MTAAIFKGSDADRSFKARWWTSRAVIYGVLILWTIVALFPIYWVITTSFKTAPDVMAGGLIPFLDYDPAWLGWRSLGLSPETIGGDSTVRDQFVSRFTNSTIVSVSASTLAVFLGSITGYGLSRFGYKFGPMKNADISFFFISQLILPRSCWHFPSSSSIGNSDLPTRTSDWSCSMPSPSCRSSSGSCATNS